MSKYCEWPGFEDVYLEDSFVLGIHESECQIYFDIEGVIIESSSMYLPPKKGEHYFYKKGRIVF